MDHTHHPVSHPDSVPLHCLDHELQADHAKKVGRGQGHIARGGAQVREGGLCRARQIEHPAHTLESSVKSPYMSYM